MFLFRSAFLPTVILRSKALETRRRTPGRARRGVGDLAVGQEEAQEHGGDPAVDVGDEADGAERLDGHGQDRAVQRRQQRVQVAEDLGDELHELARRRREHGVVRQLEELRDDGRRLRDLEALLERVDGLGAREGREAPEHVDRADAAQRGVLRRRQVVEVRAAQEPRGDERAQRRGEAHGLERAVFREERAVAGQRDDHGVDVAEQGQELLEEAEGRRGRWGCVLGVRGLRILRVGVAAALGLLILRVGVAAALGRVQLHIAGLRVQQLHVGVLVLLVGGHPHRRSVECVGQLLSEYSSAHLSAPFRV